MLSADKKRSSHRLSSLFSLSSSSSEQQEFGSVTSSDSGGRLSRVKHRLSSATHLVPEQPSSAPPAAPPTAPPTVPPIVPPIAPPNVPLNHRAHWSPVIQPAQNPVEYSPATLSPLAIPPPIPASQRSRSASPARILSSRPTTANADGLGASNDSKLKKLRRKSGLFGGGNSGDELADLAGVARGSGGHAWVVGHKGKVPYDLTILLSGEKVPELWDDQGDTLVYLFPRTTGRGPSFRIDSSVYAASQYMTRLVHGRLYSESTLAPHQVDRSRRSVSAGQSASRTASPDPGFPEAASSDGSKGSRTLSDATEDDHSERHLFLPIQLSTDTAPVTPGGLPPQLSPKDVDTLLAYRNFIAFLIGQSLVATERRSEIFDVFMRIADILQHYQFSNVDGSTFGEVAAASFDAYVDELGLADVRNSREKTIEAIVLGEHMRSMALYTEGFVHAAGKFDSIKELQHPKFNLISHKSVTRIARAAMDLDNRVKNINTKLTDFDFPAIFSGIMNSDTADEKKIIKFKNWRAAFMSCRSFAIDYYKSKYGSWLPKARSKKNNLTTSGLNRLVLKDMYHDLTSLYDLLVDRVNLTTRTADGFSTEDDGTDFESIAYRALRKVLSEYDRSTPPVQPPIPFDLPLYPTLRGIRDYPTRDPKKDAKTRSKKLKSDEVSRVLRQSHNPDSEHKTPFLEAFRLFEYKQASGSTMDELWEMRTGHWLFLYAVIQSLPMLVVDAPLVRYTEGVEYFLCEPPRSGVPWGREDTNRTRTWFGVAGGSHVVNLPTDVVEHGVEGVFRRSHCWRMAEKWSANDVMLNAAVKESINAAPLPPPPGMLNPDSASARSRSNSPDRRRESVMNLGLEALPLPAGVGPPQQMPIRPTTANDPNKTFDAILQSADLGNKKQGKKKK